MTKALYVLTFGLLALLVLGISCDNGDGDSSVLSSKKLKDLTDEEGEQVCKDLFSGLNEIYGVNVGCIMESQLDGLGDVSNCEQAYDECVKQAASTIEEDCKLDEEGKEYDFSSCEATVGDMFKCLEDTTALIEKELSRLDFTISCTSLVDLAELDTIAIEQPEPASCNAVDEDCLDSKEEIEFL